MKKNYPLQSPYFVIEGNIGSGKTTFLKLLTKNLDFEPVLEPVERWRHVVGNENLLDKFYKDTQRWAYTFQSYAFITRVLEQNAHSISNPDKLQILERSVFTDRYCFAKNCFEMGTISPLEWEIYKDWFHWLVEGYVSKPLGFIYLNVSPEVCYNRLLKRHRSEELNVPLEYLKLLHNKHNSWLIDKKDVAQDLKNVPVLVLNCDQSFEDNPEEQKRLINTVVNFFNLSPNNIPVFPANNEVLL